SSSRSLSAGSADHRAVSGSEERRKDSVHRSVSRERTSSRSRDEKDRGRSRSRGGGGGKAGVSLLVRNLNKSTSADDVKELFNQYGEVRDVYTPLDFYTKQSRGFAFVEMTDLEGAEAAIKEIDSRELDGNRLTVVMAQEKRKTPQEMRKRDRQASSPRRRDRRDRSRSRSRDRRSRRSRSRSRTPPRRSSPRRRSRSRSPARRRSPPPRSRHRSRS
ncbi:hypothetical protein DYB28_002325, partial [Aphanomyces astaci]